MLGSKKPLPETSRGWNRAPGCEAAVEEQHGGVVAAAAQPLLVPVLCSVLRAGASDTARMWAETFISLSTRALLHPLSPG